MQNKYGNSAASLFAVAAREPVTNICGWCLESGVGHLVHVNGRLVLDSHQSCRTESEKQVSGCVCFEYQGDNVNCPKHGGRG